MSSKKITRGLIFFGGDFFGQGRFFLWVVFLGEQSKGGPHRKKGYFTLTTPITSYNLIIMIFAYYAMKYHLLTNTTQ